MFRSIVVAVSVSSSIVLALPACDAPEIRTQLVASWERMAKTKGGELAGSSVKVWNLRQDGKAGECRADFLAIGKSSRIGGSLPYRIATKNDGGASLEPRGEPTLNLLQADSVPTAE